MEYNMIGVNKGIFNYNPIVINNTTKALSTMRPELIKFTEKQLDYLNNAIQNKEFYPVNFSDGSRVEIYCNDNLSILELNIILNFGKENEDNIILDTDTSKKFLGLIKSDFNIDDIKTRLDLSKVKYSFKLDKINTYITDFANGVIHFIVEFEDKTISEGELSLTPVEREELITNIYLNDEMFALEGADMTSTTLNVDTTVSKNLTNSGFVVETREEKVYMMLFTDLYDLFEIGVTKELSKDDIFKWAYGDDGVFDDNEHSIFRQLIREKENGIK